RNLNDAKDTEYSEKTFAMNIDFRYYFSSENNHRGLYISPSIQYLKYQERFYAMEKESFGNGDGTFDYNERIWEREFNLYNIRALIGYQLVIAKRIIINPYFGPGFAFGKAKDLFDREDENEKGFSFNAGIYIGIGI
ncbi:hypothetical protein ACFQ1R_15840, partial [Mariniflexile jejuense]